MTSPSHRSGRLLGVVLVLAGVGLGAVACDGSYLDASNHEGDTGGRDIDGGSEASTDRGAPLHVLFIGNSYTYVNDLPGMLANIARTASSGPLITTDEVVQGGATLEDHWDAGTAQAKIREKTWTHVVLQGQSVEPLPLPGPPSTFQTYAKQFGDLAAASGATPVYFDTWARAAGDPIYSPIPYGDFTCPAHMQDELTVAYATAASRAPNGVLVCAGVAFARSIARAPSIVLQQSDKSHPTVAGTYLAASTFYVALTGRPVPSDSYVPDGLDPKDAATLRDIALVGTDCSDVKVKGAVSASWPVGSGGVVLPFDFGTAGIPLTTQFTLKNTGGVTVGVEDARTLAPPFSWAEREAYPGGAGTGYCTGTLAPGESCTIAITFSGASPSGTGSLGLRFTGDTYTPGTSCELRGAATARAYLTVSEAAGLLGTCTDDRCAPVDIGTGPGMTSRLDLYVVNRGALPATGIAAGATPTAPFAWAGGSFPGGSGTVTLGSPTATLPYCSDTLDVGATCVVSLSFSPGAIGAYDGAADLTYEDATSGPRLEAKRSVAGTCRAPLPP